MARTHSVDDDAGEQLHQEHVQDELCVREEDGRGAMMVGTVTSNALSPLSAASGGS